jgi:hypothetical protein
LVDSIYISYYSDCMMIDLLHIPSFLRRKLSKKDQNTPFEPPLKWKMPDNTAYDRRREKKKRRAEVFKNVRNAITGKNLTLKKIRMAMPNTEPYKDREITLALIQLRREHCVVLRKRTWCWIKE